MSAPEPVPAGATPSAPSRGAGLDRRAAWLLLVISGSALTVVAVALVPWDLVPGGSLTPATASDFFSAEEVERAESYSGVVRLVSQSSYAVSLAVACLFGFTSWGSRLGRVVASRVRWWVAVPIIVFLLLLLGRLVTLPFALTVRDRRLAEGLTNQGIGGWVNDRALSLLVSWALTSLLVLLFVSLARRWPARWFIGAGAATAALTFAGSMFYPLVVEPLYNDFTPLEEGSFKESVVELAEVQGVQVEDVLVSDASRRTTTLNAYVSGLGDTRRVVVYDNLLTGVTPDEARSVIAHELAHAKHRDVLLGTALGALGTLVGVCVLALLMDTRSLRRRAGVGGPHDPAAVALFLALVAVGSFLSSPVQNSVSRAIEVRADRTALEATGDADAFRSMQRQLALRSLSDPTPPAWSHFWFGSHPTVVQRLGLPSSLERAER